MRIAYFDCFCGAGEGAILASLVDAGLRLEELANRLRLAGLGYCELRHFRKKVRGIGCSQVTLHKKEEGPAFARHGLNEIEELLAKAELDDRERDKITSILRRLVEAAASTFGTTPESVDLQQMGIAESLIEIAGVVLGLSSMKIDNVICSPVNLGYASNITDPMLAPSPLTLELFRGRPCYRHPRYEGTVTPVNAAILTTLACSFGSMPILTITGIGYGTGKRNTLLRVIMGEAKSSPCEPEADQVAILDTVIDDMNPQLYEHVIDKLLGLGALDVYLSPVHMKKARPGIALTVICHPHQITSLSNAVLTNTTSIGLRWRIENRIKLSRYIVTRQTSYGPIRFKLALIGSEIANVSPEYEDCKAIANKLNIPLKHVLHEATCEANRIRIENNPHAYGYYEDPDAPVA